MASLYTFGPESRIKKKSEFAHLQKVGRRTYATHFLLLIASNDKQKSRLGVAITRKVDPRATVRNLMRRRLREIFRHAAASMNGHFDILIIARNNAPRCSFQQIEHEVLGALKKAGCLR